MKSLLLILQFCIGISVAIETYYMDSYCGTEISMILQDIETARLTIDGSFTGDCNVTIETWYTADRLMFHFEDFDLTESPACDNSYLTVYDGQNPVYDRSMHGLNKLCGTSTPSGDFVPSGRYVTFRYVNKQPIYNSMNLVFTAFHTGYCYSYEYQCSNGRCIDDSISCNGNNPCNDGSDCQLSGGAIAGIAIGAVFGILASAICVFVVFRNRRRNLQPTIYPQPFQVTPATIMHTAPPPNYGFAGQYQQPAAYNVATSVQQKTTN